ncbi:MAG: tetrahydromethanopterin synthesis protein [Gammaproteobacteria bacterium]|nr:tetrahydromethanopterin synthesis protein [Gammaproteobacteria bacterium]|tara:strand:+ start:3311 stop:3874 length:564 start_codon:yes stop_codon:yes gene_type:complete
MIHEVIITSKSKDDIINIAPMGIRIKDDEVTISPFKPSQTLTNIMATKIATVNFIDDVRVFAGIVTNFQKNWDLCIAERKGIVPHLKSSNAHYNLIMEEFKDDEKRPNITCKIISQGNHRPFQGFNRAQSSIIEASVLVSRLSMLPIEKIHQEIEYLKIGIDKTAGKRELEAWTWIIQKIKDYEDNE